MRTPIIITLLLIFLGCCVLLILIGSAPEVANAVGIAHEAISPMRTGADGAVRITGIGHYAFAFHSLVLFACICLFVLGVSQRKRDLGLYGVCTALLAFMWFVWLRIYADHQTFLIDNNTDYFLAFPTATAWMLYGTGLCGVLLVLCYCVGFKKYVYSDEDDKLFANLVAEQQQVVAEKRQDRKTDGIG